MPYSFESLSHADFEDLTRDLLGEQLGVRFEAFAQGPDGGMDGRHARGTKKTILQAKHLRGSLFPILRATMQRERASIDKLKPSKYILATSQALTPLNKARLAEVIGPALKSESDIYSAGDLNYLLRKFPRIERSHIKLWLSSAAVLDAVVRSAAHSFNSITKQEIRRKVAVYAQNRSFEEAQKTLENTRVLIISGPPGVGKTTLAEMLSFAYIAEGWDLVAIRSLDDGFAAITDETKQVFFFDDFLGKVALDSRALSEKDSQLAVFIGRVRRSPNARFILTTRAYILEDARRISEHIADRRLDISKYILDVSAYTRSVRARILYNHLIATNLPGTHLVELLDDDLLKVIVDHDNYNPRIIEWMTDPTRASEFTADQYPQAFLRSLDNPSEIWDTAFRTHISPACRHLLIALFFFEGWGTAIERLKLAFESVHAVMSETYGSSRDPKDFEDSLKTLEGSFISIRGQKVEFINPSVNDYLAGYLNDRELLTIVAKAARFVRWAERVEDHFIEGGFETGLDELTRGFAGLAEIVRQQPVSPWQPSDPDPFYDVSNGVKLGVMIRWWLRTGDNKFLAAAKPIAAAPANRFSPWRDGVALLETFASMQQAGVNELSEKVESLVIEVLGSDPDLDDLDRMMDAIDAHSEFLSTDVKTAANAAIARALEDLPSSVQAIESESTLEDYIFWVEQFAARISADTITVSRAKDAIEERMMVVRDISDEGWSFDGPEEGVERFTDADLSNLFAPLREATTH